MGAEGILRSFHERFDIEVGVDEAKRRFMNRVTNRIFYVFIGNNSTEGQRQNWLLVAASALGEEFVFNTSYNEYIGGDFYRCLRVLEALYEKLEGTELGRELSATIDDTMAQSEIDLGIRWQPPAFVRTGAKVLDERLVNEPLRWLSGAKYETVCDPFSKGLSHYLEAEKKPHLLADVVTDMYEAVEALARIVTGKNKDLSGNQQSFIKAIRGSEDYKRLLKDYISYANQYRHAVRLGQPRTTLSEPEVESFIYLTGLFIRLAIRQTQPST